MSHIRTQRTKLKAAEIGPLGKAVARFDGCEMIKADDFQWYSGRAKSDWRIQRKDSARYDYHIGVTETSDGDLNLQYDDFGSEGGWIPRTFGTNLNLLTEQYQAEIALEEMEAQGMTTEMWRDEQTQELVVRGVGY